MVARTARYWNKLPSEFERLDKTEQAKLRAIYIVEMEMERFYNTEHNRMMDNLTPK